MKGTTFNFIFLSFLLASSLTIMPLPSWGIWFHPAWVELVLCFWVLYLPQRFNLFYAWVIGLILDMLVGSILGLHALLFTLIAYVIKRFYQQIHMFPRWQQGVIIFIILALYQIILFWLQAIIGQPHSLSLFWISPLISMLLWPLIANLLQHYAKT